MNSMLKQHHIRLQDLKSYLRGYGTHKPQTPEEWAVQESKMFAPGMLIFCLDSIAAPPGLAQFSKKEVAGEGETYRVKDMSVVVSMVEGKPLGVNITASAFELRFLEQLMLEKARKAILDGRDFLYVAATTTQPLDSQMSQVLETLATTQYKEGGSRRTLAAGDSGAQEPAQGLLSALGVTINQGGPAKHVLDVGNVCHLLFAPEGRQEDKNKVLMKTCFQPIGGDPSIGINQGQAEAAAPAQMKYEDVTAQGADQGAGWTDPTQWVEPQVPGSGITPEAWQPPEQEIPFPAQPAQWIQPGSMDQVAAGFLNPDSPVQVPEFPQPSEVFDGAPAATPSGEMNMPRPTPLGSSPRQSMTDFKAVEDTGTFRKFDNAAPAASSATPGGQADLSQAAAAAFAASAAVNDTAPAPPAAEAEPEATAWIPVGTPSQPFLPPPVKTGGQPQHIRPQAIRPQSGQDPVSFQVETGIYRQFGAPPAKQAEPVPPSAPVPVPEPEPAPALEPELLPESEPVPVAEIPEPVAAEPPPAQVYEAPQPESGSVLSEPQVYAQEEVPEAPAQTIDESSLSLFDRLNLKLSKVKTDGSAQTAPVAPLATPPKPAGKVQESAELFGWETPEEEVLPDSSPQATLFQTEQPTADEWQSWDTPTPAEPIAATQQDAGLAEALSGLMENQSTYEEPAAYTSSHTAADFASQAPEQEASYESSFVADADQPPGWAEFQESFKTPSSFSDIPAASAQAQAELVPAAELPAETSARDLGWVEPAIAEQIYEGAAAAVAQPVAEAAPAEVTEPIAEIAVPEPAAAAPQAPVVAPPIPPAISASNPFLAPLAAPPPPPPPDVVFEAQAEEAIEEAAPETVVAAAEETSAQEPVQEVHAYQEAPAAVEEEPPAEPPPPPKPPRQPTAEEQAAVVAEMASFQKKLEQQLAKAAKKLNSRVEEIKAAVSKEMERLAEESSESDKHAETVLAEIGTRFTKQLENVTEDVRLKISDAAANGRYTIKQLLASSHAQIEEERNLRYEALREASKQFRSDTDQLSRGLEKEMQDTVNKRTHEVGQMVESVISKLRETGDAFVNMVELRFERFKERMSEETNTVTALLDRSVNSMMDELEGTNEKSTDKLKSSKSDFEQAINYQVRTAELTLSRKTRQHLTLTLLPKLNERKEILRSMSTEMCNRFSEESTVQVNAQMQGLEASLNAAKGQLHNLVTECLSGIDSVGRNQQAGLEEIFKEASGHIEKCTLEVTSTLTTTEKQIQETEMLCKKLAETSSVDADPQLTEVRNTAHTKVLQIKQQATSGLITAIDSGCDRLEQVSQQAQAELTNLRTQYAQGARQASDNGLASMRDAIQEALAAIQAAREKYME
ncbi:MAG: hypothetical protein IT342_23740 [Candidatus Melainabacteria bacterium]|nr:hypothetical protein [Candidatus Melainabacteria bacterium]